MGHIRSPDAQSYLLVNCALVDSAQAAVVADAAVWIRDGRIQDSGPRAKVSEAVLRDGLATPETDMGGRYIAPGLIDCHTHFGVVHPGTAHAAELRSETPADLALRMAGCARRTVESGVTAVRLVGEPAHVDFALRRAVVMGDAMGPRIVTAGRSLTTTGGHGQGVDSLELTGATDFRRATRLQLHAGADWIKVMASGGVSDDPIVARANHMELEEMQSIVATTHAWGRKVAVHAGTEESARLAARAGVDSIEHGYELSDETIQAMIDSDIWLVPTLLVTRSTEFFERIGASDDLLERVRRAAQVHRDSYSRAVAAGVKVAMGTDFLPYEVFDEAPAFVRELEYFVECGMSHEAALRSATTDAARLLGKERVIGALDPGMCADLVAMTGNPLSDIASLRSIDFVMKGGFVVRDQRSGEMTGRATGERLSGSSPDGLSGVLSDAFAPRMLRR